MNFLLTIAGHDPIDGAGITADLATWRAMGLQAASVVSALTVQNSQGLERVEAVDARLVRDALQAVLLDGEPAAIKVGMLGSAAVAREVTKFVVARGCPVVVDPVLAASNGRVAHRDDAAAFLDALMPLLQRADVITPNLAEATALLGERVDDALACAQRLRVLCRGAVVLKGGHADDSSQSVDWVVAAERSARLASERLAGASHGTGCVFSAVLAGMLAQGWDVFEAATEAKLRVHAGIAQGSAIGPGRLNTNPDAKLASDHLPTFHWIPGDESLGAPMPFARTIGPLGFYPIVDSADWVERLLAWGVRTIQLRIKQGSLPEAELKAQLAAAVRAAREIAGAQLFVNDHWRDAIELGAYGVHLGQEDLANADLSAMNASGLRLGVSSHTPLEMARAHAVQPSYVALGPVYPTTLKAMRYAPLGLERLRDWTRRYQPRYPVVAIGGISLERAQAVRDSGVDSIAVVSAVTQAERPRDAVEAFLQVFAAP
ncbi:MAG: thiamine phosphate synthase [Betaproteobacteria bacterium]|nr:MAG: thiamine phosphate synthase [Betaproteobacteria bacterium]